MKRPLLAATISVLLAASALAQPAQQIKIDLPTQAPAAKSGGAFKTEEQKTIYALGVILAPQVKQGVNVLSLSNAEYKFLLMGLRDAVLGEPSKVPMDLYGPKVDELAKGRIKIKADKEKAKSKDFLAKAAKEPGVQVFPSGLIYKETKAGTGPAPTAADTVKAHYKGTLVDGVEFDSSAKHGNKPMEFPLNGVIPCWTEGIQKMKVGGKAKLVCPSEIAYGDRGNSAIPGGAALVFEVELVGIKGQEPDKEFLAKAAQEPGAKASPSGLIYTELKAGKGASPKPADTVKAHYHGTLSDGTVFDSSVQRGAPGEFSLTAVIKCWQEGIPKMKVGGKAKLVCPAGIAYGDEGRPGIPGGAALVFEVELLEIVKK